MVKKAIEKKNTRKSNNINAIKENPIIIYGLLFIFLVMVFLGSSYKVSGDDDFFWHLATGRYIVENNIVPDKDVFGFLTQGTEWIPFEWGWDVISYLLYTAGGYNLILIARSVIFCAIFLIYFMLLKKFRINTFINLFILFLLFAAILDRLSPRPHIFTYLFFTLTLYILLSFRYIDRVKYFKWLYFLPLIFLLWCNIHMGVLAGGLLLFIFVLSELLLYFKPKIFNGSEIIPLTRNHFIKLIIISTVCALMLHVNPHGIQTYLYAFSHTKLKLLESVNEWQSPFTNKYDFGFIVTLYKVFLFSGILVLFYAYKRKDLLFALIFIGFAIYSVRAIRFTVDYEIIIAFFVAVSLNYILIQILKNKSAALNFLNGNILKGILAIFFIYIISQIPSNNIYNSLQYNRFFGWGINEQFVPVQLFDFMKENNISGKPYNHFGTGGYLIWNFPDQKNFIDSRNLNDEIFNKYNSIMNMSAGFEKTLDETGVDYVVFLEPALVQRTAIFEKTIVRYLSRNENWKLIFWDDKSMLFVKNLPKFSEVIQKYEYRVIVPYKALFSVPEFKDNVLNYPDAVKSELDRKLKTEPNGILYKGLNDMTYKIIQNKK